MSKDKPDKPESKDGSKLSPLFICDAIRYDDRLEARAETEIDDISRAVEDVVPGRFVAAISLEGTKEGALNVVVLRSRFFTSELTPAQKAPLCQAIALHFACVGEIYSTGGLPGGRSPSVN